MEKVWRKSGEEGGKKREGKGEGMEEAAMKIEKEREKNNISLVWSWIESWIAESCLVRLTVQTFHSYGDIMLLAKASKSKQTFDLSRSCGLFGYISIHESKFQMGVNPVAAAELRCIVCRGDEQSPVLLPALESRQLDNAAAGVCCWWLLLVDKQLVNKSIFGVLDVEKKGKITFKKIHELLKSFDTDSDGRINKDDFITCLRRNPLLVALFSLQLMHKNLSRVNT
ncbi:hypothetical protein LOK49_LG02G00377 [Camellia lanceoleosa]|uniref:Uncharacterized protein n=1 Tax=Camellia lanceoleosa TaxID=1840588 RepID=A0ACC0IRS4_9ERIC|nr:hypothetical protein LOK49_LG02G00377 [Camellia lanceoleosa]